ncbi:MAG: flagellar export chaperone FliS [Oscillospiraceae bacterium]|nr:flagellar export chaperone FliS [Oscillospiraceae bacterium]
MNPYATYKKQAVNTMTPIEVIVKLYDESEKQLHRAINFIEKKEYDQAHNALDKSAEFINALRSVLDMNVGEISQNLDSLYEFFYRQIIQADMKKDIGIIEEIIPQISELKDAFTQISKLPRDGAVTKGSILSGSGLNS